MANFNGDVLNNTALHVNGMVQSGSGTNQSPIAAATVSETNAAEIVTKPLSKQGSQDGYGQYKLTALAGASINPIPRYMLACYDTTNTRRYWTDTAISLTNAPSLPGGATYVSATLVIIGRYF